jgi:hypothetical protein
MWVQGQAELDLDLDLDLDLALDTDRYTILTDGVRYLAQFWESECD